ncbi:MAG: type II toxin-antitoxin system VapC family toxin [Hymenobacteraceae bacterium]|nr:type II toxin-antitoxin system VapC family toxin [Hymenobacteraceae bacterium]
MADAESLLLDTHTVLWYLENHDALPTRVREAIDATGKRPIISVVSWWEIAIKLSTNKLRLLKSLNQTYETAEVAGFARLSIQFDHLLTVSQLPYHHRDPFDRLLIAQALTDDLTLVSRDSKFDAYGVRRLW